MELIYKFSDIRNGDLFELNKIYKISENIKNTGFIQEINRLHMSSLTTKHLYILILSHNLKIA